MYPQAELHSSYVPYMEVEEDEVVSRNYTLERVPSYIEEQLKLYTDHRISPLNRMRRSCQLAFMVGVGGRGVILIVVCHATKTRSIEQCARGVPPT